MKKANIFLIVCALPAILMAVAAAWPAFLLIYLSRDWDVDPLLLTLASFSVWMIYLLILFWFAGVL